MERRFIITGGGTSGHINPALAIARLLTDHCNAAGDTCRIMFTGRKAGLEGELVPAAGYDFRDVPAQPVPLRPSIKIFLRFCHLQRYFKVPETDCRILPGRRYQHRRICQRASFICSETYRRAYYHS